MQTLKEQITQTASDVNYIKVIIAGDQKNGVKGIVQRFDEYERLHNQYDRKFKEQDDRIGKIEKADYKKGVVIATASAGVGAVTGATGMAFLKTWLMKIFAISTFIK